MLEVSRVICLVIMFVAFTGCGMNEPADNSPSPGDPVPVVHSNPIWLSHNTLLFENLGATDVESGSATIHLPSVGVVKWEMNSGSSELSIPNSIFPSVFNNGVNFGAIVDSLFGKIVLRSQNILTVLEEDYQWPARSHLSINHDGTLYAWRSFGTTREIGIWIFEFPTNSYHFIGPGSYPSWHPTDDKLIYRCHSETEMPFIVEYHFATALVDTILKFESGNNCKQIAYSPDGTKIAYWNLSVNPENMGIYLFDPLGELNYQLNNHTGTGLTWGERGIVYTNSCSEVENPGCGVLWIVDPGTGESCQLTERFQFLFEQEE